jgi:glycosyltransferase involved in cell wall biosynthesis
VCADFGIPLRGHKGASVHVRELVRALVAEGNSVLLLSPNAGEGNPLPDGVGLRVVQPGAIACAVRDALQRSAGDLAPRLPKEVRELFYNGSLYLDGQRALAAFSPDLIYERYTLFNLAGLALARRLGVPHLLEVNAPLRLERERTKGLVLSRTAAWTERLLLSSTDGIFAVSTALRRYLVAHGAAPERTFVLPNGVDLQRFRPARLDESARARFRLRRDARVIGFAGSLKPWHGVDVLLRAFARVHRARPDTQLLVVGEGPEAPALRDQAGRLGLMESVIFTGAVGHDDMPLAIASMDVATAPYRSVPEFYFSPLKLYEYLACGVATVASDAGEIASVVRDGSTGLLCPPDDDARLSAALLRLVDDPTLRVQLGRAGRAQAERHSWSRNARAILACAQQTRRGSDPCASQS